MKKTIKTILVLGIMILGLTGCAKTSTMARKEKVKITKVETKMIKYTDFDNGLIKMKLPEGWKVDVLGDYIHYTIKAYDPTNPTYQFFFNFKI